MKRILTVVLLLFFAGTCVAADLAAISGNYTSKKDGKERISIYPDGTFILKQRKFPPNPEAPFEELSGKYEIQGETFTLILTDGGTASGTLKGNTFEDGSGTQWVKDGSQPPKNVQRPGRVKW